jgi:hypothetical protein
MLSGLLYGCFAGMQISGSLFVAQWKTIIAAMVVLVAGKLAVMIAAGQMFGLSRLASLRAGACCACRSCGLHAWGVMCAARAGAAAYMYGVLCVLFSYYASVQLCKDWMPSSMHDYILPAGAAANST